MLPHACAHVQGQVGLISYYDTDGSLVTPLVTSLTTDRDRTWLVAARGTPGVTRPSARVAWLEAPHKVSKYSGVGATTASETPASKGGTAGDRARGSPKPPCLGARCCSNAHIRQTATTTLKPPCSTPRHTTPHHTTQIVSNMQHSKVGTKERGYEDPDPSQHLSG